MKTLLTTMAVVAAMATPAMALQQNINYPNSSQKQTQMYYATPSGRYVLLPGARAYGSATIPEQGAVGELPHEVEGGGHDNSGSSSSSK